MRTALFVAAFVLGATTPARAHQDYAGDVHPRVVVEGGRFVIIFTNNRERRVYRMEVSTSGAIVSPRQRTSQPGPQLGSPVRARHGKLVYLFPAWEREHNGRPFYRVGEGAAARRVDLPWGRHKVGIVHDAMVNERDIVLVVTPGLQLFRFAPGGSTLATASLGEPYAIYDFPRASNLASHRGSYLVCWIDKGQRLLLSAWKPASAPRTIPLLPRTDWNTTLSIGVIGDVLLLAYHGLGPRGAEIKTLLRKLPL